MRTRLDKLFIFDLECTCWEGRGTRAPDGQVSDIIEVGICELDLETLEIGRSDGLLIKPGRSIITPFCTQLTSIDDELLTGAQDFRSVMNYVRNNYSPHYRTAAAWGNFDGTRLRRECAEKGALCPIGPSYLNLKNWFSIMMGHRKEKGLARALKSVGLEFEGRAHRGVHDAINTARLVAHVLRKFRG